MTLHYSIVHYTILYYSTLLYTTLYYMTLQYTILQNTVLYYSPLYYTTLLYNTTMHYIMLQYTTLQYTTLYHMHLIPVLLNYLSVCERVLVCQSTGVEVRRQLAGNSSLILPCKFKGLNPGPQSWQQIPVLSVLGSFMST